jgi:hypothetical protein
MLKYINDARSHESKNKYWIVAYNVDENRSS